MQVFEVSEDIYAMIQGRGEWFANNIGGIVGERFAVLVDTVASEKRAKILKDKILEVTDKPIRIIVNTHGHPDHIWTNHLFDAIAICHENARAETEMASVDLYSYLFPEIDFSGAKVTPQDVTFKKSLKLNLGFLVEILHVGKAHTSGDAYVYIPEKKVVFCGDLLFAKPCTPFALSGSVLGYLKAIEELLKLEAEIYVPGHGNLASKDELLETKRYLEFVYEETKKGVEKGLSVDEIVERIDLGEFASWSEAERIYGNVARAYSEIKGIELQLQDLVAIAQKMLAKRYR